MTLFVGSLTAQKPAPSDNQTMKSQAMTTLKLVDDYKADAEKTGKTDVPTESQKRAELAINKLANVTLCSPSPSPNALRVMPEMSGIEVCSTLRNRMDLLMSDTRKIAIVSTQFQISHRDDIRANLSQVIKEYEEDRVWVLATIDRWKTSNAVDDRTR